MATSYLQMTDASAPVTRADFMLLYKMVSEIKEQQEQICSKCKEGIQKVAMDSLGHCVRDS